MRKIIVLCLSLLLASIGCAAWLQNAKTNPLVAAEEVEAGISFSITLATSAFNEYVALANGTVPATVIAQFNRDIADIANGETVAADAVNLAIAAGTTPNLETLFTPALQAVQDLGTFLSGLGVQVPGLSSPSPAPAAQVHRTILMQRAIDSLSRCSHRTFLH